ncbi:immunity 17 family protein [Deinococcus cellulosilyticus]|nr:immunity 17 family protein [Deinococcus cellulosilyticus]
MEHWLPQIFLFGGGVYALAGSVFNWNWFFEDDFSGLMVEWLGRKGARIFYAGLGLFLVFVGWVFTL